MHRTLFKLLRWLPLIVVFSLLLSTNVSAMWSDILLAFGKGILYVVILIYCERLFSQVLAKCMIQHVIFLKRFRQFADKLIKKRLPLLVLAILESIFCSATASWIFVSIYRFVGLRNGNFRNHNFYIADCCLLSII